MKIILLYTQIICLVGQTLKAQSGVLPPQIFNNVCQVNVNKSGFVWVCIDNYLQIKLNGIKFGNIEIQSEPEVALLNTKKSGIYKFNINYSKSGELKIFVKDKLTKETLNISNFKLKKIPDPIIIAGKHKKIEISKSALGKLKYLTVLNDKVFQKDCPGLNCKLVSCEYFYQSDDDTIIKGKITGPTFDNQLLALCKKGKKGDQIIFVDLEGICPGDRYNRNLHGLILKVK